MKKLNKRLSVLLLALALVLSIVPAVWAASEDVAEGTEQEPAKAEVVKVLKMPVGTNMPGGNVEFTFTPVEDTTTHVTPPSIFTDDKVVIATTAFTNPDTTAEQDNAIYKVATALPTDKWTAAGIYEYSVKETSDTLTMPADPMEGAATYDKSEYTLKVYVVNGNNGVYVKYFEVLKTKDENGNDITDPQKVNANIGSNGFAFTNTYTEKISGESDPDAGLSVNKTVTGDLGNHQAYFPFSLTVTKPALITDDPVQYTAYILDAAGAKITDAATLTAEDKNAVQGATVAADGTITVTSGTAFTFKLQDKQKLYFADIHTGATYTVQETDPMGHTVTITQVQGGVSEQLAAGTAEAGGTVKDAVEANELKNFVTVENKLESTPPTGLFIENLPYFLMALIALLIIGGYVYMKSKRQQATK